MDDKKLYWLWLQGALGPGARTDEITAVFPSPGEMYSSGEIPVFVIDIVELHPAFSSPGFFLFRFVLSTV